jgi:hypothetical protein
VGTYTNLFALPRSPDETRTTTVSAAVANFGISRMGRDGYLRARESNAPAVLGRVLFGFLEEGDRPWVAHDPAGVVDLRRDVVRAISVAAEAKARDEYADWFEQQLRIVDGVLEHAVAHREWVVAVFEGDVSCFRAGGVPRPEPGDSMFAPHCLRTMPAVRAAESRARFLPVLPVTGMATLIVAGLALAAWRHRRLASRR